MRDGKTRLRVTPHPGVALRLPDVRWMPKGRPWVLAPGGGIWSGTMTSTIEDIELGESYLELTGLDLDSEEAIMAFVQRWGVLGVRFIQNPATGEALELPDYRHILGERPIIPALRADLKRSVSTAVRHAPTGAEPWQLAETLAEFCFGARLVRDLLRAWRWQSNERDQPDHWESELHGPHAPGGPDNAAEFLDDYTHALLAPFYPQFMRFETDSAGAEVSVSHPFYANVPLLQLMGLELYNHACEQADYKTCRNETCQRLFVRQQGRAKHGQHRASGVLYCSFDCARAQTQRAYRRRRRASA